MVQSFQELLQKGEWGLNIQYMHFFLLHKKPQGSIPTSRGWRSHINSGCPLVPTTPPPRCSPTNHSFPLVSDNERLFVVLHFHSLPPDGSHIVLWWQLQPLPPLFFTNQFFSCRYFQCPSYLSGWTASFGVFFRLTICVQQSYPSPETEGVK